MDKKGNTVHGHAFLSLDRVVCVDQWLTLGLNLHCWSQGGIFSLTLNQILLRLKSGILAETEHPSEFCVVWVTFTPRERASTSHFGDLSELWIVVGWPSLQRWTKPYMKRSSAQTLMEATPVHWDEAIGDILGYSLNGSTHLRASSSCSEHPSYFASLIFNWTPELALVLPVDISVGDLPLNFTFIFIRPILQCHW